MTESDSMGGIEPCKGDCGNKATAVYEAPIPPAGSVRVNLCWECAPDVTPVRYLHTGSNPES